MIMPYDPVVRDKDGISDRYKIFARIMNDVINIDRSFELLYEEGIINSEIYDLVVSPMLESKLVFAGWKSNDGEFPDHYQELKALIIDKLQEWRIKREEMKRSTRLK